MPAPKSDHESIAEPRAPSWVRGLALPPPLRYARNMTPREWLLWLAADPTVLAGYLAALPILAFALGQLHRRGAGNDAPWKYLYSALVYAACIPGMFASMVTLYMVLFLGENLLDVNALVTLGPIASMCATLFIASRNVDFGPLPGFGRLSGLMVVLGLTFGIVFALSRTRLFLVFGGSIFLLLALGSFVFALLTWGGAMAFRRHDEPPTPPPKFGA